MRDNAVFAFGNGLLRRRAFCFLPKRSFMPVSLYVTSRRPAANRSFAATLTQSVCAALRQIATAAPVLALAALPAWAVSPFKIKDIRVEGVQRTEAGTVFSYLPVRVGDTMDDSKAAQAIRALYATGFYSDVRVEVEDDVLVVFVVERPAIALIEIEGAKEFPKDNLKDGLKQIGLSEAKIFDRSLLDRAEKELKRQYQGRGMYSVEVKTTVTPLERNRVSLRFDISEGEVTRISQIKLIGTSAISDSTLLKEIQLTTPGWFTWFTKDDQYSKQKLTADLETIRAYYLNRGYLDFSIDSTQVSITPDKERIFITVNVTEGPVYNVGDVKVAGETIIGEPEVRKYVTFKQGEIFNRQKLIDTNKLITDRLGNDGYSFANVNAVPEIDREKRIANFTVFVDPGKRTYVRRINVSGNTKTRDEVIRREFRQLESAYYNNVAIDRSKVRLERTNFFESVNVETPAVPATQDQIDVNVAVVEKNTGQFQFGIGYSRQDRLSLQTSVSQANIFGSGNQLSFSINNGSQSKVYSLSYYNPYWTVDGIGRGFDIYRRDFSTTNSLLSSYETNTAGGAMTFAVPVTETDSVNFGLAVERTRLTNIGFNSPQNYRDYVTDFGERVTTVRGNIGYARDTRDSINFPTRGTYQVLRLEAGLPGGDLRYYSLNYQHQWLYPIFPWLTFSANGEFGYANGYGNKQLPFFKNLYAGGVDSVRAFESFSLGPRDENGSPVGGNRRVVGNFELLFPMPGTKLDKSVRLGAFYDVGNVWGKEYKFDLKQLRTSAGVALSWVSPVGPLRFSLGVPLRKAASDKVERFQFLLGKTF
jgi:outer membrane protein insertion porin family